MTTGASRFERAERRDDSVHGGQVTGRGPAAPTASPISGDARRAHRSSSPICDAAIEACPFVQSCRATAVPVKRRMFLK